MLERLLCAVLTVGLLGMLAGEEAASSPAAPLVQVEARRINAVQMHSHPLDGQELTQIEERDHGQGCHARHRSRGTRHQTHHAEESEPAAHAHFLSIQETRSRSPAPSHLRRRRRRVIRKQDKEESRGQEHHHRRRRRRERKRHRRRDLKLLENVRIKQDQHLERRLKKLQDKLAKKQQESPEKEKKQPNETAVVKPACVPSQRPPCTCCSQQTTRTTGAPEGRNYCPQRDLSSQRSCCSTEDTSQADHSRTVPPPLVPHPHISPYTGPPYTPPTQTLPTQTLPTQTPQATPQTIPHIVLTQTTPQTVPPQTPQIVPPQTLPTHTPQAVPAQTPQTVPSQTPSPGTSPPLTANSTTKEEKEEELSTLQVGQLFEVLRQVTNHMESPEDHSKSGGMSLPTNQSKSEDVEPPSNKKLEDINSPTDQSKVEGVKPTNQIKSEGIYSPTNQFLSNGTKASVSLSYATEDSVKDDNSTDSEVNEEEPHCFGEDDKSASHEAKEKEEVECV